MIKLIKSTFYKEKETKKLLCNFIAKASQLSFGEECEKFEQNFARWQGRKHCVFLNSGSSANLAVIQSLINLGKLQPGDSVGFSALTWSTNVMPLIQLGLKAVPIDVELGTLNVSSKTLLRVIKKYPIKLLFLTNLLGFCDDIEQIRHICREEKILFLEDNCESLGTRYRGRKLGNFGLASTFSFYVGHHMSTIEGGAVCTDSESLATMLRLVRAHGWDRNLTLVKQDKMRAKFRVNSTFYSRYTFYDLGYNLRTTEINGFLGNHQLKYMDQVIDIRQENFLRIARAIYALEDRYFPVSYQHIDLISNFAVPIICKTKEIRDQLVRRCDGRVEIRPIVGGDMTRQPFFIKHMKEFIAFTKNSNAGFIHDHGLYFGNNPELTQKEIDLLITLFTE